MSMAKWRLQLVSETGQVMQVNVVVDAKGEPSGYVEVEDFDGNYSARFDDRLAGGLIGIRGDLEWYVRMSLRSWGVVSPSADDEILDVQEEPHVPPT